METALLIARVLLSMLLVAAAAAKLVDRDRFRKSLRDFGVSPRWTSRIGTIIPTAELLAAALLLLPQTTIPGAVLTFILLLIFTAAISYNLVLDREPECHCFGQIGSSTISIRTLLRNGLLTLVAGVLVAETPGRIEPGQRMPLIIALSVAAVAVTLFALVYEVVRRQKDLHFQVDDLRESLEVDSPTGSATAGAQRARRLPLGTSAPSFQLASLDEREISLADILSVRRPAVIFFLSADCSPCMALLPEITLWRHEIGERLSLVVVSKGSTDASRTKYANARIDSSIPILADQDGNVLHEYGVKWTPGAICIGTDGTIASQLALGNKQIRSLLTHLIFSPTSNPWVPVEGD